jgi:choline dehydrogenase-like flavoprotein
MQSFDYIIVGAGAAGCVLAARLTEDPDTRVLLLEAGPRDRAEQIQIPLALTQLAKSKYDWDFDSEPEPNLDDRRCYLPRGRVLGGSTSTNSMVYTRGNRADYDEWEAKGAVGWGWHAVLPYFLRAEDNERGRSRYHGTGGLLSVSDGRNPNALNDAFLVAGEAFGISVTDDFNGEQQDGVGYYQVMQRDGRRCSAASAYLHPAASRPNLTITTGAYATRLLLDGTLARGVEVDLHDRLHHFHADSEVIVAAGAYNTPQLLMLSGIGPQAQLSQFDIRTTVDLPVGENLQDHPLVVSCWLTDTESLLTAFSGGNRAMFVDHGRGPLTSNVGQAGGFVHTEPGLPAPDIQLYSVPAMIHEEGLGAAVANAFSIGVSLLYPSSRGRVVLRAPIASAKPRILHNYYDTEQDRQTMAAGLRLALELSEQAELRKHVRTRHRAPGSADTPALREYIRRHTQTTNHPTSTCSIGQVVDSQLRVLGIERLRIVDASVMPTVIRGNTAAPTIMIAEKAADLIRGDSEKT